MMKMTMGKVDGKAKAKNSRRKVMKMLIQLFSTAIILTLILGGCKTIQGGGWIKSKNGDGKAKFGIDIICEDSMYYGEFTYHDKGYKVEMPDGKMLKLVIHAWVDPTAVSFGGSCGSNYDKDFTEYDFSYKASPDRNGEIGTGTIKFWDADLSGNTDDKDKLCIVIYTGPFEGYDHCEELGGGNLTIYDD
jgi:hypothetical protein